MTCFNQVQANILNASNQIRELLLEGKHSVRMMEILESIFILEN